MAVFKENGDQFQMNHVLVDTSAWIDFLRSGTGVLGDIVARSIEQGRAVVCGVVVAELLQGAKGLKEQKQLQLIFETVGRLETKESDWDEAGKLLQNLRVKGITVPLTDAIIAVLASRSGSTLLTVEKHFQHLPATLEQISD
ncbi:MAG: PIN domain-containing protein [Nitrospinae bacterium]|nr:PIN domain-containing protein [Nitrospinota bacterium]